MADCSRAYACKALIEPHLHRPAARPSSGCRADFCDVQLAAACMFSIRKKAIR
jgi:hypothetical protein